MLEVLLAFLKLGVTSFGGPIAHIGYFRTELVVRRRWVDEATYTDLVALCQFLPGPSSSQLGFSLGLIRAGYWGGLAAWLGFTLPSALLMTVLAAGAQALRGSLATGLMHGLKLVAVAIVAQAVWGMARTLCPDRERASIAGAAAIAVLCAHSPLAPIAVILLGGLAGLPLCRAVAPAATGSTGMPVSRRAGIAALCAYALLLVALPAFDTLSRSVRLFDAFYRSGALVFGGGHVVLPLLQSALVDAGWVTDDAVVAGYGAVQAMPGPLFSVAAYLGALAAPTRTGAAGALCGIVAIFLPGLLVVLGALPFWDGSRRRLGAQAAMRGINAAVVGLLGAALYDPLWTTSIESGADVALALAGFILLTAWRAPPLLVVVLVAAAGMMA